MIITVAIIIVIIIITKVITTTTKTNILYNIGLSVENILSCRQFGITIMINNYHENMMSILNVHTFMQIVLALLSLYG